MYEKVVRANDVMDNLRAWTKNINAILTYRELCELNNCVINANAVGEENDKHGAWLRAYRSGAPVAQGYVSSCCDMWSGRKSRYCPDCGRRMDRKE